MPHIDNLIQNISRDTLLQFLRTKISSFKPDDEDLDYLFTEDVFEKYESIEKIGEAVIDNDDLIVITSKTTDPLTERSGKKKQYEIAKKILKHEVKDAALFVFYDDDGNFRFSFVKANYLGTKRDFTDFKRYTYFVSTKQTNRTFMKQVGGCNFNSLDEIIEAFSVEPLNKLFYQEIAKAFYNLIGGKVKISTRNVEYDTILKLPSTPTDGNRKVYQEFGVRLIGRTIFCWFLKNKKSEAGIPLIPESWLSFTTVKDSNNNQHNYYHTILEKLFFLVLNKKQDDRIPFDLPSEQEIIPFLNGGLFEPHIYDFFGENGNPNFALDIPNQWFKELFEVLEQYNFTIDENSIYDAEVSIDPEMLGTIFENLLAEIDPDTEKSARKATGSFYTPREIVDYMVEQSLIQYLKTKINIDDEELLQQLFKEGGENKFNTSDTKTILQALSDVKILDPACGSGAFPMGALHKIINALHKLDADASWWKARQIENVPNALAKQMLKEKLDGESADYIRKLGVIQNSIYGVDIQPIASEISKLRSFLSLVIDETINDKAENRGVQALPNLEFKFVTANTLIGLEAKNITIIDFGQTEELQDQLKEIRNAYLQSYGDEKERLKEEFEAIQNQIYKNELAGGLQNKRAIQLTDWKPFSNDDNAWFDPYWMYGVEKFDIVIGNPPYRVVKKSGQIPFNNYKTKNSSELYSYFFERSISNLLKDRGIISFITASLFIKGLKFDSLRVYLENSTSLIELKVKGDNVFDNVQMPTAIFIAEKGNKSSWSFEKFNPNLVLIKKIESNKTPLNEISDIMRGFEIGRNKVYNNGDIEFITGSDIKKWQIKNYRFILNDTFLEYSKNEYFFDGDRILIRETGSSLTSLFIKKKLYCNRSLYSIKINNKKYSPQYVTALLNSKLLQFYYNSKYKSETDIFPKIRIAQVNELPILFCDDKVQNIIASLVDKIIPRLEDNEIKKIETKIDVFVFKLYELNYNEVLLIDTEFNLNQTEYDNFSIN